MKYFLTDIKTKKTTYKYLEVINYKVYFKLLNVCFSILDKFIVILPSDNVNQYKLAKRTPRYIYVEDTLTGYMLLKKFLKKDIIWCFKIDLLVSTILIKDYANYTTLVKFYDTLKMLQEQVIILSQHYDNKHIISTINYIL